MNKFCLLLSATVVALPALADYEINYPLDTQIVDRSGRIISGVGVGSEIAAVDQASDMLLYHDLSETAIFNVTAGEVITPVIEWGGAYMHGYFYADLNNDGKFDVSTELLAYSYYQGVNSLGVSVNENCNVTLPVCLLPASLPAGDYRVRYVIDWNACDPGGRTGSSNTIVQNAGAIVDATFRVAAAEVPETPYDVNYPQGTTVTHAERRLQSISVSQSLIGSQSVQVGQDTDNLLYHDCTDQVVSVLPGATLQFSFEWIGTWMNSYVYIDTDCNGVFTTAVASPGVLIPGSELMAFSYLDTKSSAGVTNNGEYLNNIPAFTLPSDLAPGNYVCRAKIDWDNSDPAGGPDILKHGGSITDFTINVVGEGVNTSHIHLMPLNGIITLADGSPVPEDFACGYGFDVKAVASVPGFETDKIIVRNSDDEGFIADTEIALSADGIASIPGQLITGDVTIYALFEEQSDSEWTKIWGDEFNGDKLNTDSWSYQSRANATWNRFCANTDAEAAATNTFGNGYYNAWCIPTDRDEFPSESTAMISGAINTNGKFHFHYGRIEARIKTNPYTGNFPAFWLMPETNAEGGWPRSGEIDIWEQIDASDRAYSTIHSGWTGWKDYCYWTTGPQVASPTSTSSVAVNYMYTWHYYALEWDEDELRWYVDGEHTFSYKNQHYSEDGTNYTAEICWPFYKDFYVILNQSVGSGAWAANCDSSHTYLTQFDYVRVYQKKGENNYTTPLSDNGDDPEFYAPMVSDKIVQTEVAQDVETRYYDLQGRRIANPTAHGLYIKAQGNKTVKILR